MNCPDKLGSEYYRQFLTTQGRICYDHICRQLNEGDYSGQTTIEVVNGKRASEDCFGAVKAVRDDHPEYFYLGNNIEFIHKKGFATVKYPVVYPVRDIQRVNVHLEKKITSLTGEIGNLGQYIKEKTIYERIAREMKYKDHNDGRDHSVVGPLLLSSGVCEGQNALLIMCLRRVGIPCIKVYGKTEKDEWHCWTIAWIDGRAVHLDVTWDNASNGIVYFDYFNLSDKQVEVDHFDFSGEDIPVCETEYMDYYHHYRLNVKSFSDLCTRIGDAYSIGVRSIMMHFDYQPLSSDYFREIGKAVRCCNIREGFTVRSKSKKENIVLQINNNTGG